MARCPKLLRRRSLGQRMTQSKKKEGEKDMQIGILGTGRMGVRLAAMFADSGHELVLGSRDVSRAKRIASGLRRANIMAGSYEEATNTPIVLPALFIRDGLFDQLESLR